MPTESFNINTGLPTKIPKKHPCFNKIKSFFLNNHEKNCSYEVDSNRQNVEQYCCCVVTRLTITYWQVIGPIVQETSPGVILTHHLIPVIKQYNKGLHYGIIHTDTHTCLFYESFHEYLPFITEVFNLCSKNKLFPVDDLIKAVGCVVR